MSQQNPNSFPIDPLTVGGTALAARLNELNDAMNSSQSGTSRPSYAVQGYKWIDKSNTVNIEKFFTGTVDLSIINYDTTKEKAIVNGGAGFTDKSKSIIHKFSTTANEVPLVANMVAGEFYLNSADKKIFFLDSLGAVASIGDTAGLVKKEGDTMTGALNVPEGGSGTEVPQMQEVVRSVADVPNGENRISNMVSMTQADYDFITPDGATLYVIQG